MASALAALVTSGASRATALSCAGPELWAPARDALDVPTNTLVWCPNNSPGATPQVVLTDADGATVAGTQTRLSSPDLELLVFRPDSDLAPNSEYQFECPRVYDVQDTFSFTTGASSRSAPPAVPNISAVELRAKLDEDWGDSYYAKFEQVAELNTIIVLDLGGSAMLSPQGPSGYVADADFLSRLPDSYVVGYGPCGGSWPGAALGATTTVAIGAFDLTGAFSGWSDTIRITLPATHDNAPRADEDVSSADDVEPPDAPDVLETPEQPLTTADDLVASEAPQSTIARRSPVARPKEIPPLQGRATCQFGAIEGSPSGAAGVLAALLCMLARRTRRSCAAH
jgi:hypothetical protein